MSNPEKLPTTPVSEVIVDGVRVWSRWQKQHELALLSRVVSRIPPEMRRRIEMAWIDSQVGSAVEVKMRPGFDHARWTGPIGQAVAAEMLQGNGGFNLIAVGDSTWLDPDWLDDGLDGDGAA